MASVSSVKRIERDKDESVKMARSGRLIDAARSSSICQFGCSCATQEGEEIEETYIKLYFRTTQASLYDT